MGLTTIEWAHYTFNGWIGCAKVTDGCRNCYAERENNRFGRAVWGVGGVRHITSDSYWKQPLAWNRKAEREGVRFRVFSASMADVFEDHPGVVESRARLFALIRQTPHLDWLLLTKRPENIARMLPPDWGNGYPNVWLGTSVEDQRVVGRIALLTAIPAVVHFLSCEPLIGELDLVGQLDGVDWVIAGGESGPHARPIDPMWARRLRDRCISAGVAFFFKQWGEWAPPEIPPPFVDRIEIRWMENCHVSRLGKERAGRVLDGRTWDDLPIPRRAA